ncbi:MAG: hypothetical protein R2728_11990 [Chitinophagales bacterium]
MQSNDTIEDYDPPLLTIVNGLSTYYEFRRIATGICDADTSNSVVIILNRVLKIISLLIPQVYVPIIRLNFLVALYRWRW